VLLSVFGLFFILNMVFLFFWFCPVGASILEVDSFIVCRACQGQKDTDTELFFLNFSSQCFTKESKFNSVNIFLIFFLV
jgi:hypothetical protein